MFLSKSVCSSLDFRHRISKAIIAKLLGGFVEHFKTIGIEACYLIDCLALNLQNIFCGDVFGSEERRKVI